ncbi:MAG: tetratricopeptide repeat protein [Acidobacteriota bacterium]
MKNRFFGIWVALLLALVFSTSWASESNKTNGGNNAPSVNEVLLIKQRNELRTSGFDALYNIEYAQAQDKFEQLISLAPEHPAGYIYKAASFWLSQMHHRRRLQTCLFNSSTFRSDLVSGPVKIDEKSEQQFYQLLETAREKAETMRKQNSRNTEALYFLGVAYAIQAGYEAAVTEKYFSALRAGMKAADLHRKLLKLDPNFVDAYLTIGFYDYVVANLPLSFRIMGSLFGIRGNEARGIAALERVVKEGKYTSDDARVLLIGIYKREKRHQRALELLMELRQRYCRNYLLTLETAALLVKMRRYQDAFQTFEQLLNEPQQASGTLALVHFHYGDALIASGRFIEAVKQFLVTAQPPSADCHLAILAHFRAGQAYDLAKQREQAIEQYREVLNSENTYNIHSRAREYLKRPYLSNNDE